MIVLATAPFLLARLLQRPMGSPDAFWHLRTGQYVLHDWRFSGPEPGWTSFDSQPWVLHEWLPEVLMYATFRVGGLPALAWLTIAAVLALYVVIYFACRDRAGRGLSAATALVACLGASAGFTARPQLVSFILLALVTGAWLRTAEDLRARWWLVPVTWVWAMCHGMWFVGVLVGLAVVVPLAWQHRRAPRVWLSLAVVPAVSLVGAALTPVGPGLLLTPLHISGYTHFVSEWDPPNIRDPYVATTLLLAAVVVIAWSRRARPVPLPQVALFLMALGWTALYARTVALGAAMLGPLAATAVQDWRSTRPARPERDEKVVLVVAVALALSWSALLAPGFAGQPGYVPTGMDKRLDAMPQGTVVFNELGLGGWLLWDHRNVSPMLDGRIDVYDPAYVQRFLDARDARAGWEDTILSSGARYALLEDDRALTYALQQQLHWQQVATDRGFVLLEAPTH